MAKRAWYIDRIRVILTALVILHHTAITYGAPGGWYYRELPVAVSLTGLLFIFFVSANQAFFMGFFFLLAGYFTPVPYDRKGPWQFLVDRLIRLGIPLAFYAILLDPLTNGLRDLAGVESSKPFFPRLAHRIFTADWNNGPLWFAQALLLFALAYIAWRIARRNQPSQPRQLDAPLPTPRAWLLSALAVGAAAWLIRLRVPVGHNVFGLQLGYFSSYIFLFALGCVAWQRNWLERLPWRTARAWLIVSIVTLPMLTLWVVVNARLHHPPAHFDGGLSLAAIFYSFWEPFVAWGIIAAFIACFRDHFNNPSAVWEHLGARAYTVYIIHPPVLVTISVLLRHWQAPALAKFAIVGPLTLTACVVLSSLILLIPGSRRIV